MLTPVCANGGRGLTTYDRSAWRVRQLALSRDVYGVLLPCPCCQTRSRLRASDTQETAIEVGRSRRRGEDNSATTRGKLLRPSGVRASFIRDGFSSPFGRHWWNLWTKGVGVCARCDHTEWMHAGFFTILARSFRSFFRRHSAPITLVGSGVGSVVAALLSFRGKGNVVGGNSPLIVVLFCFLWTKSR